MLSNALQQFTCANYKVKLPEEGESGGEAESPPVVL